MHNIRTQFPMLVNHPDMAYLDTAATALKPQCVLDAVQEYYTQYGANIHRGLYEASDKATQEYESVRGIVADFIGASAEEIIFTTGATAGLNMLARSLEKKITDKHNIVISRMEHHANLIPWQQLAKRIGAELRFIELTDDFALDLNSIEKVVDEQTAIVSLVHVSNSLGTINPITNIVQKVRALTNARIIVDGCQAVAHMSVDVKELDVDAYVFSGHKLYGPTGTGVMYGKKSFLESLAPSIFGGDMIERVDFDAASWAQGVEKFEAGTPNIAGIIGLGKAIAFIQQIGFEQIMEHEAKLTNILINKLTPIEGVEIIGLNTTEGRLGVVSFTIKGIHTHDIAEICNRHGVAIRAGHHCTMPLMKHLGIHGTARMSFGMYTSKDDIDKAISAIKDVIKIFA